MVIPLSRSGWTDGLLGKAQDGFIGIGVGESTLFCCLNVSISRHPCAEVRDMDADEKDGAIQVGLSTSLGTPIHAY